MLENTKYELYIFSNDNLGVCDFVEGYDTEDDCLARMKELEKIDDSKEHFTIIEFGGEKLEDVIDEKRYNSKYELID